MKCPICNENMFCMTPAHIKKHNMTMQQFREQYKLREYNINTGPRQYDSLSKPWIHKGKRRKEI